MAPQQARYGDRTPKTRSCWISTPKQTSALRPQDHTSHLLTKKRENFVDIGNGNMFKVIAKVQNDCFEYWYKFIQCPFCISLRLYNFRLNAFIVEIDFDTTEMLGNNNESIN